MPNLGMSKREFTCITNRLLARQSPDKPRLFHRDIADSLGIRLERYYQLRSTSSTAAVTPEEEAVVRKAVEIAPSVRPMTEPLPSTEQSSKKILIYSAATAVASSLITLLITL